MDSGLIRQRGTVHLLDAMFTARSSPLVIQARTLAGDMARERAYWVGVSQRDADVVARSPLVLNAVIDTTVDLGRMPDPIVRTSLLARMVGCPRTQVIAGASGLEVVTPRGVTTFEYRQIGRLEIRRRTFWADIQCEVNGQSFAASGLPKRAARLIVDVAQAWRSEAAINALLSEFDDDHYLTHSRFHRWLQRAKMITSSTPIPAMNVTVPHALRSAIARLHQIVAEPERSRAARNDRHVQAERSRHASLFSCGQSYELTQRQQDAILHNEDNALVVAGAGTGKTSTIVGKCLYVIEAGLAKPNELLLVAFTRKASEEMKTRLDSLGLVGVKVSTFHALGLEVLARSDSRKPNLSVLAEDSAALERWIQSQLKQLTEGDPGGAVSKFVAYHRYPYLDSSRFRSEHEYIQYMKGHDVRTLRGERVRSLEECLIANWLTMNGVRYEYERAYEHDTASVQYRQYKPDFYLTDYGVYIEHFGLNASGEPAPFLDRARYLDGMEWKRQLHRKHGTVLVESYSHQRAAGTLFTELESTLRAQGVSFQAISGGDLKELVLREEIVNPMARLVMSFLSLFKGNCWTLEESRVAAGRAQDRVRSLAFLDVFEALWTRYESELRSRGEIDFNDMINEATQRVRAGRFQGGFRYVLVDEYQDIGRGRARLLQALLDQVPDRRFFCVGDDWQSIYRFTGSDITLMTAFADYFGFTRRTDLDQTYRFNDKLLDASSRFVMANPAQLKKSLLARTKSDLPAIVIMSRPEARSKDDAKSEDDALLRQCFDTILREDSSDRIEVLVLGRYNFCAPKTWSDLVHDYRRLSLRFLTVHGAKGLEADYAVVLDVRAGKYGFPTEIVDDPILDMVLAGRAEFANAEERRLFYVALTRAKRRCFLLTDDLNRSAFVDELESPTYSGLVLPSGASARVVSCPICIGGRLQRRDGVYGLFWGCSNYPACEATARACPWCGVGAFVKRADQYSCANGECRKSTMVCPSCRTGAVIPRHGPYGTFHGCTEWRREGPSCDYKQRQAPSRR